MWPSRKKNRRQGRESVLPVKSRGRDPRLARVRALIAVITVVVGTTAGALLIWQAYKWALIQFVFRNESYAIRRIEIRHEGRLRPEQIRQWAGVSHGQNLLALDLDHVRHNLEMHPWIGWADVQARRPDCLRIAVREREPVAQIVVWRVSMHADNAWAETNYVDAEGVVLPPLKPHWVRAGLDYDFSHLPRLVGLEGHAIVPGQKLSSPMLKPALELIRAYEQSELYSRVDLERVDLSGTFTMRGFLRGGTEIVFGVRDFERQMRRWHRIHQYAEEVGRRLEWLDLSVTNNLPARWRASTNEPAGPTLRSQRHNRRHV